MSVRQISLVSPSTAPLKQRATLAGAMFCMLIPGATAQSAGSAPAPSEVPRPRRPVHTYSIVARDPETGALGVAVQSHWFSVGSIVAWAEAGVGAVATQSFVDPSYGPLALELLRAGKTPQDALRGLLTADAGADVRQVGVVDIQGRTAAHTGARCIPEAGHRVGEGYTVQANLMERNTVPEAMARGFEAAKGPFGERLLAALEAAQKEKGDIRGQQSACLLIVAPKATGRPWEDRLVDLRVEDHPDPVTEIKRLLRVHQAYQHMNAGDVAIEHGDAEKARSEYSAAEALQPENLEMVYWHAVALANAGSVDESLPLFRKVFRGDRNWVVLTPRLVPVGILKVKEDELARILAEGRP